MIYRIRHYNLHNSELLQFLAEVLAVCSQFSTEPMNLAAVILALRNSTTLFDDCFKVAQGSQITDELRELDGKRDDCLVGIHYVLLGYSYHFQNDIKKAAEDLLFSMDKYGTSLSSLNYESESSTITNLIHDWKTTPSLVAALTLLSMGTWSTQLETSNNNFLESYRLRNNEKATKPQVKTFNQRKAAVASYQTLVNQIEARITMDDNTISYQDFVNNLNVLINRFNIIGDSHITENDNPNTPKKS